MSKQLLRKTNKAERQVPNNRSPTPSPRSFGCIAGFFPGIQNGYNAIQEKPKLLGQQTDGEGSEQPDSPQNFTISLQPKEI
jgi:hypothetical protein